MKCKALTKDEKPCSRNALKNGYCKQHGQEEQIRMYKKELSKMHKRVRFYSSKTNDLFQQIELIQRLDYIKLELIKLGGSHRAFRYIAADPLYKNELEDLFDAPFEDIVGIYLDMLRRRNAIVHKYSAQYWVDEKPTQKIRHCKYFLEKV